MTTLQHSLATTAASPSRERSLTWLTFAMLTTLTVAMGGLVFDPRTIAGAPAWLKPAKFALSAALYSATLVLVLRHLGGWPRVRRAIAWTTTGVFVLEVALVIVQAVRGTTSHFNVATPLDSAIFGVMGAAIFAQTAVSALAIPALWRTHIEDAALGASLRAAMVITVCGALAGGLMTAPTATQLEHARATGNMPVSGAHTVGAPDGGPGLPGTAWSRDHGDLRIPHFVGLHALQVLPLLALLLRGVARTRRVALVRTATVSYATLFTLMLLQAWLGQPLLAPGPVVGPLLGLWAAATTVGAWTAGRRSAPSVAWQTAVRA